DGRPYPPATRTYDPPRAGEIREVWTVKLDPGKHTVAIVAETAVSKGTSEPIGVEFSARGLVKVGGTPKDAPKATPLTLYVVAVGVSDYAIDHLKLRYA